MNNGTHIWRFWPILAVCAVLVACTSTDSPGNDMLAERSYHTATLLTDGRILVVGAPARAEVYDPTTGDSSYASQKHLDRRPHSHTATLLADGRVLVAGGIPGFSPEASREVLATATVYDPVQSEWSSVESMTQERADHTATRLSDGRILVAGGKVYQDPVTGFRPGFLATVELYDPAKGEWSSTASMAEPRASHTATLLPDGRLLVVGGLTAQTPGGVQPPPGTWQTRVLEAAEVYDPARQIWSPAGTLEDARTAHTATLLPDGRVLVVGGQLINGQPTASAEVYDPSTGAWSVVESMAEARMKHTATLLSTGRALVAGGVRRWRQVGLMEVFDPVMGTWTPAGKMAEPRHGHEAVRLPDGRVLAIGGAVHRGGFGDAWQASTNTVQTLSPENQEP